MWIEVARMVNDLLHFAAGLALIHLVFMFFRSFPSVEVPDGKES